MWLRMCVCEWRCCVSVCDLPWLQVSGLVRNDRLTLPSTPYPPGQTTELTHLLWRPARSFYPFSACTRFLCRVCVRALVCVVDFCQSKTSSMWRENSCHAFVLPYCEFCGCYKLVYAHSCVFHCEMESSTIDSFHWIKFVCPRCTLRALGFLFTGKKKQLKGAMEFSRNGFLYSSTYCYPIESGMNTEDISNVFSFLVNTAVAWLFISCP